MTIKVWMNPDKWFEFENCSSYEIDDNGMLKIYNSDCELWTIFAESGWIRVRFYES